MKEHEYIAIHDLATIRAAERVLRDLTPGSGVIVEDEYTQVMKVLQHWRLRYEAIANQIVT